MRTGGKETQNSNKLERKSNEQICHWIRPKTTKSVAVGDRQCKRFADGIVCESMMGAQ